MDETLGGTVGDRRKQTVPGFTPEQSWAMDVVAERAATRVVEKFTASGCPFPCSVRTVVLGSSETGVVGLDDRVRSLETFTNRINRITWVAVSGVVLAVIGIIATLVQVALIGK